jgi:hypothetical protein
MFKTTIVALTLVPLIAIGAAPENLLENPGFETQAQGDNTPPGWHDRRGKAVFPSDASHSGKHHLRLVDPDNEASLFFESERVHARPGGTYTASAWVRTAEKGSPGVYLNFYDQNGTRIHHKYVRTTGPTDGWVRAQVTASAPDKAVSVTTSLYSFKSDKGSFDFDDIGLGVVGGRKLFGEQRVKPTVHDPVNIGTRRELFVDDFLIDGIEGARFKLGRPHDEGPVLRFDQAWEGLFSGYCTIIQDGDLLRLYYRGRPVPGKDGDVSETTSYAESQDGITWTRPELGLYEFNGNKKNNIVLMNAMPSTHNFAPWIDTRPGVPKAQRFKALGGLKSSGLFAWVSADGIRWKMLQSEPVMSGSNFDPAWNNWFDSQNLAFWSEAELKYIAYFRVTRDRVRQIGRATSDDFIHWTKPIVMPYRQRGKKAPVEHLYTNQTHPYFRAPHLYLSVAARFMPKRQVLTEAQAKAIDVNPGYFKDTSDAILMTSRPGNEYFDRTILSSFVRPGIGAQNWVSRSNYPARGLVPTGPAEMSVYLNQDYAQPTAHLRRYSLRLDGLMSLHADYDSGEVLTKPLIFDGNALTINFATSAAGGIRIELQDAKGNPHPGFTIADCREQIGNEIERHVTWKSDADLSTLAGKPVRLRILLKDADLYALRFKN